MIEKPTPASGVSTGRIRVTEGRIIPSAPASSAGPMSRGRNGTEVNQGMLFTSSSIGVNVFMVPAMPNATARSTCTTQSAMCVAFDGAPAAGVPTTVIP